MSKAQAQEQMQETLPAVIGSYAVMQADETFSAAIAANIGSGGITPFDLDRVRVPAGGGTTFEIPGLDGVAEAKTLEGVIVHWRSPRGYWRESFDATGGGTPPDCSSDDGITGVGDPGGECGSCPLARFGSSEKGRGQACRQMRLLFMVREGDRLPIVVVVPPSSLKEVGRYFLRLAGNSVPYYAATTRLELRKTKNKDGIGYSEIVPSIGARLTQEETSRILDYAKGLAPVFAAVKVDQNDAADAA